MQDVNDLTVYIVNSKAAISDEPSTSDESDEEDSKNDDSEKEEEIIKDLIGE